MTLKRKHLRTSSNSTAKRVMLIGLSILLLSLPIVIVRSLQQQNSAANAQGGWPTTPSAQICGNTSLLSGPATPPTGAITVPAGDNSTFDFGQSNATYWFTPGIHTLGTGQFNQIIPGDNATFIGGPGAILDGQKENNYAFTQHAKNVTIKYLTIQNFGPVGSNNNEGVVNHDAGQGWTISYNTVKNNAGAGVFIGSNNTLTYNCLDSNEQYGFSSYDPNGLSNVVLDHNEISNNDTYDWEAKSNGCGCTGGGKFWDTDTATITNNYVHDNKSVGIWADTNDTDFLVENNYIANNNGVGLFYEISYNMTVRNNNFVHNAWVDGVANPDFPTGAIYLSESGGDSRVPSRTANIDIYGNNFEDNWSGVILWENADRFCNSPSNTSDGTCTMVNPNVTTNTCVSGTINNEPYYSDCRWKTQNVKVHDNVFSINKSIIPSCASSQGCGLQGIFSNWGSYPSWSPYTQDKIQNAIAFSQNNLFSNNQYFGDWKFMAKAQGSIINFASWQAAPFNQDPGSIFNGTSSPSITTVPATSTPTSIPNGTTATPVPTNTIAPLPTATPTPQPISDGNALDADTAGIENSLGKWTNWYATNVSQSTREAHSGTQSMFVKVTASNGWGVQLSNWPGFSATSGLKTISFWAKQDTGKAKITMKVQWFNASRKTIKTGKIVISLLNSSWQKSEATVSVPSGATSAYVTFTGRNNTGTTFYIDDVFVSK